MTRSIDVRTAVDIQYLESVMTWFTRPPVSECSETAPDAVFNRLRGKRLVDLPPRGLIERLNRGKVSLPEYAASALQAFF